MSLCIPTLLYLLLMPHNAKDIKALITAEKQSKPIVDGGEAVSR